MIYISEHAILKEGTRDTDSSSSDKRKQFPARDKIHNKIQITCVLESAPEVDNEGVSDGEQDVLLVVPELYHTLRDYPGLADNFDSVVTSIVVALRCSRYVSYTARTAA
jgi:hypothetical protein